MTKLFRFLYDIGLFPVLIFVTFPMFLMGIMWNRHYVGFGLIQDTYKEKIVVLESHSSVPLGGGSRVFGEVIINGKKIEISSKKYIPKGDTVTIWYSPHGCGSIDAFEKREGEQIIDLQKSMYKNFFQFFMILNMPFLLLLYYSNKFSIKDEKKKNELE